MPLDPAFGFAMVGVFFEDWRSHEIYSYAGNVRQVLPVKYYELGGRERIFFAHLQVCDIRFII